MAGKLSYDDAVRVAGELFGNLFGRDSDEAGFDYALKALLSGEKTTKDLVAEFVCSDEFRELHLMNQTPNEFSRRVLTRFLNQKRSDPKRVKELCIRILEEDWRRVMISIVNSEEYIAAAGEHVVPLWV